LTPGDLQQDWWGAWARLYFRAARSARVMKEVTASLAKRGGYRLRLLEIAPRQYWLETCGKR
jgi:hypothetical protein